MTEYVVIVTSEPLGLPSNRIYGPYKSYDEGRLALMYAGLLTEDGRPTDVDWKALGVQQLRRPGTLPRERP